MPVKELECFRKFGRSRLSWLPQSCACYSMYVKGDWAQAVPVLWRGWSPPVYQWGSHIRTASARGWQGRYGTVAWWRWPLERVCWRGGGLSTCTAAFSCSPEVTGAPRPPPHRRGAAPHTAPPARSGHQPVTGRLCPTCLWPSRGGGGGVYGGYRQPKQPPLDDGHHRTTCQQGCLRPLRLLHPAAHKRLHQTSSVVTRQRPPKNSRLAQR